MTQIKYPQIKAYNLIARLLEDGKVEMIDVLTDEIIVTIETPGGGLMRQFQNPVRIRAYGTMQRAMESKMSSILEGLMDVPEMDAYL